MFFNLLSYAHVDIQRGFTRFWSEWLISIWLASESEGMEYRALPGGPGQETKEIEAEVEVRAEWGFTKSYETL